ncbi:hypothetical protein F5H01DRAFT_48872 [Linnemannia elongata]|nr:hypothetical protein F5H01DRAFT_48872 [Linnemannia elongata]
MIKRRSETLCPRSEREHSRLVGRRAYKRVRKERTKQQVLAGVSIAFLHFLLSIFCCQVINTSQHIQFFPYSFLTAILSSTSTTLSPSKHKYFISALWFAVYTLTFTPHHPSWNAQPKKKITRQTHLPYACQQWSFVDLFFSRTISKLMRPSRHVVVLGECERVICSPRVRGNALL